jgi:N-acetylmuramoyl-L-alanine amidase
MNYIVDHIPLSKYHRPGIEGNKTLITIHNTGLPNVPAINFRKNLGREDNTDYVSFHIVVDDKEAIECVPLDEMAYHCANSEGNLHSIGIEVCEVEGAEENAIKLVAKLLKERNFNISRVTTHQRWNGKYCPRLILPHWSEFIENIKSEMEGEKMKNTIELPIGYLEFLEDRIIVHFNDKIYVSIGLDGIWAAKDGQYKQIL